RIRRPNVPTAARHPVTHVGNGSRCVVGHRLDHHRNSARAVSLVSHFLVVDAFQFSGALFDRSLDVFLGHRVGAGILHRGAESCIAFRIAATLLCGERNLTNELREQRPPFGVGGRFVMLDLLPFTVTSHRNSRVRNTKSRRRSHDQYSARTFWTAEDAEETKSSAILLLVSSAPSASSAVNSLSRMVEWFACFRIPLESPTPHRRHSDPLFHQRRRDARTCTRLLAQS